MSFGKTIVSGPFVEPKPLNFYSEPFPQTLDYGNRSKQLCATAQENPTEVYSYTDDDPINIAFTALQSHRLAMKKAQEDTVGADVALAKLQNQLAAAEREKQARQWVYSSSHCHSLITDASPEYSSLVVTWGSLQRPPSETRSEPQTKLRP